MLETFMQSNLQARERWVLCKVMLLTVLNKLTLTGKLWMLWLVGIITGAGNGKEKHVMHQTKQKKKQQKKKKEEIFLFYANHKRDCLIFFAVKNKTSAFN